MNNNELIKFIFNDSDAINSSKESWEFLKQIINANIKDFKLDVDSFRDLYIWRSGTWKDGIWKDGQWTNGTWLNGVWEDGSWYNGKWIDGVWNGGIWHKGVWLNGVWEGGKIWNPKTKKYKLSSKPPNECEWSLSYDK